MTTKSGKVSTICIKAGTSSEKQTIDHSDAMIMIIEGVAEITSNKENKSLKKDDSVFIHKGSEFQISNKSKTDLIYVLITGNMKVDNETSYR